MDPDRLQIVRFSEEMSGDWNDFVKNSKNGTFLLNRNFMDYHSDRFEDVSFVAFEADKNGGIAAIIPAAIEYLEGRRWLTTHPGLTYGGWITDGRMTVECMLRLFAMLREWAHQAGLAGIRYKAVPRCYHRLPADEDLYALFAINAEIYRTDVSSVIDLHGGIGWSKGRRHALSKARRANVAVALSSDFKDFHEHLSIVLSMHGAAPVHSVEELKLLAGRFPKEIRLYVARMDGAPVGYVLLFDCGQTVHTQYMCATIEGRDVGALESIIHKIQYQDYSDRRYLSFGISTEQNGKILNSGLIKQKEMFGGRAFICPFYVFS